MVIRYCIVPCCTNNSLTNSKKLYVRVPLRPDIRKIWFDAINPTTKLKGNFTFVCEDHFNLEEDAENWMEYKLLGNKLRIKKDTVPHKNLTENQIDTNISQISPSAKKLKESNREALKSRKKLTLDEEKPPATTEPSTLCGGVYNRVFQGKPCAEEYETHPDWAPTKFLNPGKIPKRYVQKHSPNILNKKLYLQLQERHQMKYKFEEVYLQEEPIEEEMTDEVNEDVRVPLQGEIDRKLECSDDTRLLNHLKENNSCLRIKEENTETICIKQEYVEEEELNEDTNSFNVSGVYDMFNAKSATYIDDIIVKEEIIEPKSTDTELYTTLVENIKKEFVMNF